MGMSSAVLPNGKVAVNGVKLHCASCPFTVILPLLFAVAAEEIINTDKAKAAKSMIAKIFVVFFIFIIFFLLLIFNLKTKIFLWFL